MSRVTLAAFCVGLIVVAALVSQPKPGRDAEPDFALRAIGALQPRLSPDGERVVFSYQGAIWVMPAGGGVMKRLTDGEGLDIEPAWSSAPKPPRGNLARKTRSVAPAAHAKPIRTRTPAPSSGYCSSEIGIKNVHGSRIDDRLKRWRLRFQCGV